MGWKMLIPGVYEGIPSEQKEEKLDERLELNVRLSNIPPGTMKTHRLETWQHKSSAKSGILSRIEPWWPEINQYAEGNYDHPLLTFLGTVGTGKTHMAFGIGWAWLERGQNVLYYQVENLLDALRRGYSSWQKDGSDDYNSILQFAKNVKLLILDDFGAQHETEWAASKLDQIIDYRYEYKKPLIVTTNLALNLLPARIADRLSEGLLVQLTGESFRKQRKASGSVRREE